MEEYQDWFSDSICHNNDCNKPTTVCTSFDYQCKYSNIQYYTADTLPGYTDE